MEFTHEFHVPSDVDTTFATLIDLEKVAPCLPGATLEEVDGDTYTGRVKVKVGPIQVIYRGTAEIVEVDHEAHRGRIEARGKETRGAGTASADVVATLHGDDQGTTVVVNTDLHITGKPAQFGRGVMADVGTKIIDSFAERLRAMLEDEGEEIGGAGEAGEAAGAAGAVDARAGGEEAVAAAAAQPGPEAVATGAAAAAGGGPETAPAAGAAGGPDAEGVTGPPTAEEGSEPEMAAREPGPEAVATGAAAAGRPGPRRIEPTPGREDDALDLLEVAGAATAKRVLPVVALLAAIAALVWWLRRR
jgi:uncharacterized protein